MILTKQLLSQHLCSWFVYYLTTNPWYCIYASILFTQITDKFNKNLLFVKHYKPYHCFQYLGNIFLLFWSILTQSLWTHETHNINSWGEGLNYKKYIENKIKIVFLNYESIWPFILTWYIHLRYDFEGRWI